MSVRAEQYAAQVLRREQLSEHFVRLELGGDGLVGDGLNGFGSTGIADEWVGLVVPGQFQSRYYTVRSWAGGVLTLDVVVHDAGLVTEWAMRECVGETVTLTEPKGSFAMPADAGWLYLVGDLTALPAMARIVETYGEAVATHVWAEVPEEVPGYFPEGLEPAGGLTWLSTPPGGSALATLVETLPWIDGPGYFWMAGESAQMRAIRRHLMREVKLASSQYDVMGYWRAGTRQPRAVDPGPIYRAGKAQGLTDEQIWERYDAAREDVSQREQEDGA